MIGLMSLSDQADIILDPNSNRGIKIRINSTVQTGFVPGMLLSPLGDLSHTSTSITIKYTLSCYKNIKSQKRRQRRIWIYLGLYIHTK
jgi:hypothetical protein